MDKGGKIKMYLKSSTGDYFDAAEKIPPCWATSNMSHCVKGGFAAAYFRIPEKSVLRVQLTVSSPGDADISHEWDIETADVGSGDVQARILFLKQNHSEYQQQWGSRGTCKICQLVWQVFILFFFRKATRKSHKVRWMQSMTISVVLMQLSGYAELQS